MTDPMEEQSVSGAEQSPTYILLMTFMAWREKRRG